MHANTRRVVEAARALGLSIDVVHFPDGTRTAADAAAAIGCHLGAIVKSLVFDSDAGPLVALASGRNRVDPVKVAAALGISGVRRAEAKVARAATGFPIGGTAPFGHPQPVPMLFDPDLLGYDEIWAAAGTPDTVFAVAPRRLVEITGAPVVELAQR